VTEPITTKNYSPHLRRGVERKTFKKVSTKVKETQKWLPFEKIVNGLIRTKDGRYIKILEIDPQNFLLKKPKDRNMIIDEFKRWSRNSPITFQIKVITEKTDITSVIEQLNEKTRRERDLKVLKGKQDYENLTKTLSSNEASSKRFFIIIEYEGNPFNGYKRSSDERQIANDIGNAVSTIKGYFANMGNPVIDHVSENDFLEEFLYRFICKRSSVNETIKMRKQRIIRDIKYIRSIKYPDEIMSTIPYIPLDTMISPRGIDFGHPTYSVVDGICYSFLFIRTESYPSKVNANWTACFDFGEGVDLDMFFIKQDKEKAMTEIARTVARGKANYKDKSAEDKQDLEDTIIAGSVINNKLRSGEDLFNGVIMLTIWDYDLQRMKNKRGQVISRLNGNGIKTLPALMDCHNAYKMALPMVYIDKHLFEKFKHDFTTSGLVSTYPFNELRVRDEDGFVLGLTGNSLALYNNFNTKRYNNANIGIFGCSGSGKTYTNLMLSRRFRLNDVGVIFILPMKGYEYKEAVEDMNGLFLDLSPGSGICLNVMAIHAEADIDAAILSEAEVTSRSKLQQQITQVITFVQLLLRDQKLTATEESELESELTELYDDYGITHDNLSLYDDKGKIKPMPTLQDLFDRCIRKQSFTNIITILKPFINGNCKNMNGQTNISLDNKMIAFDITNVGDRYLPAFMFLALIYSYDKIKENTYDKYALFLDEGWKFMINEMAENFVNELVKIVRGYAGSTVFSTQNLSDVLNGKYGKSIIDNCATKVILKVGENEADIYKKLFNLSDEEIKQLQKQIKGYITMLSNGEKLTIETKTSRKEHLLYTTDPNEKRMLHEMKMRNQQYV
jgi:hypothetical protein